MVQRTWTPAFCLVDACEREDGAVQIRFMSRVGATYTIEYSDQLGAGAQWRNFVQRGSLTASNSLSEFRDDFTSATSGSPPAAGNRYYRFYHNAVP